MNKGVSLGFFLFYSIMSIFHQKEKKVKGGEGDCVRKLQFFTCKLSTVTTNIDSDFDLSLLPFGVIRKSKPHF